jgi:hypothetical protein
VVRDDPTAAQPFEAYGLRFDSEETCFADQSHGFQLESSLIRSATALERLCGVLAITTLSLVAQGTAVVTHGTRRGGDAQWFRGQSSLKLGWNGVHLALSKGYELITRWYIAPEADPVPAMASNLQHQPQPPLCFALEFQDAVA